MSEDVKPGDPVEIPEVADPERRSFMKTATVGAVAGAMAGKFSLAPIAPAQAQPAGGRLTPWWPSKWGAQDEAGASNHITPAKVMETAKWIRAGKVYKIGRVYESGMPLFGARAF